MSISMCKTPSNSNNLQDKDLPPVTLITGKEWRPSEKEFRQWSISYPDADLQRISRESCAALRTGFRSIQTDEKLSEACTPL